MGYRPWKYVTFLSPNKKVTKEVGLRGTRVALPRAKCVLLRISRGALTTIAETMAMRHGSGTPAPMLVSFRPFLAEIRKGHS